MKTAENAAMKISSDLIKQDWVQTEKGMHLEWAELMTANAAAAKLLHILTALIDKQNSVVVSRETLADMANCSVATVKRSVKTLKELLWIQVVQIGGQGGTNAYVLNTRVAWTDKREKLDLAIFTANVISSRKENPDADDSRKLKSVKILSI